MNTLNTDNHSYSKSYLCQKCGISPATLRRWLALWSKELTAIGYTKNQKVFTPKQWRFVIGVLDVNEADDKL